MNRVQQDGGPKGEGTVTAIVPDPAAMLAHVRALFGNLPKKLRDGLVELAWTDKDGKLSHSRLFTLDELAELVQVAARLNTTSGTNVYLGAALRKPSSPRKRRTADADFYALTALYADFDKRGDLERAEAICRERGVEPSFKVITGRHPHPRAQLWFRLQEPQLDPEVCRRINRAIADGLGGDVTVVNPGRVMRLGGSIAWPKKPGRIVEGTDFLLDEGDA